MFKYRLAIATFLSALSLATLPASSLMAQAPPQGTKAGVLACKLSPSIGLIIGSRQRMSCRYDPNGGGPPEFYTGVMNNIGLDIGITAGGVLAWGVVAPTAGPMRGALGRYLCGRIRRDRSRCGSWCKCPGGRIQPLDRTSASFSRGIRRRSTCPLAFRA